MKKITFFTIFLTLTFFLVNNLNLALPGLSPIAYGEEINPDMKNTIRYSGNSRYQTAIEISKNNWPEAYQVVLARGDAFPDALAGAVLANSPEVKGPLLLTESNYLQPEVLQEMKRLKANTVYILGGAGAIAGNVETALRSNGLQVVRIEGEDRYETAANIATKAIGSKTKAFLASGTSFADALSISSYAAAQGIPLLLTAQDKLPEATAKALKNLGVTDVTLIGGESAVGQAVEEWLKKANYNVDRLSGQDRFQTNTVILDHFQYNLEKVFIATGMAFPDALAGSVLAARGSNPVLLVPKDETKIPGTTTSSYLAENRQTVKDFFILGGSGAVNYKIEFYIRNGKLTPRISLQFWDGYGSKAAYERLLSYVPGNLTDYIHILVPNFAGQLQDNGSFAYNFPSSAIPRDLVSLGQSKGAEVVPMIFAGGETANKMLLSPDKRRVFVDSADKLVRETNADGIHLDLEDLADNTQQGLTSLMKELYERLNPQDKLVIISVMSKTSRTAEPWYAEYNYRDLAQYADYIHVMSYDKNFSTSAPGPIAPPDWVRQVMAYAVTEIPSEKILMGVPYYGRTWALKNGQWVSDSFGWAMATKTAAEYGANITRETTPTDPVGVPTFKYVDKDGYQRTAYFDDRRSWEVKLHLIEKYNLGGIGGWAMGWINEVSAPELYPLLKEHL